MNFHFCPTDRNENRKKAISSRVARVNGSIHCLQTLPILVFFVADEMKSHVNVAIEYLVFIR